MNAHHDNPTETTTTIDDPLAPGWYAIHTRPLAEPVVAAAMRQVEGVDEVLLPVFHRLKPRNPKGLRVIGPHEVMFPNYVLLRGHLNKDVAREILRIEGADYLLGTTPDKPSRIPDAEVALVRHLADADRDPRLGDAPVKGRVARVVTGPLRGIEGLVLWRNRHEARLATHLRMAAGSFELRLPLDVLALAEDCRWSTGEATRPRHRGGHRRGSGRPLAA